MGRKKIAKALIETQPFKFIIDMIGLGMLFLILSALANC
jgi:hypothetical protein